MKKLTTPVGLAMIAVAVASILASFVSRPGGYGYTVHLNNKLVGEYYLTSTYKTPTVTITNADLKSSLVIYFNECGKIGADRKLSIRSGDQKILKEWSFKNSVDKHDALEVSLQELADLLSAGKIAIYYNSERVTKPQILAYLSLETSTKSKATSR